MDNSDSNYSKTSFQDILNMESDLNKLRNTLKNISKELSIIRARIISKKRFMQKVHKSPIKINHDKSKTTVKFI